MAMQIASLGSWEIDLDNNLTISEELRKLYHLPLQGTVTIMDIYKNIPQEDIDMLEDKLSLTRIHFETVDLEFRYFIEDQLHYMTSRNTPQFNKEGIFTGIFGTVQDITSIKLTEFALKKSQHENTMAMQIALLGS